ncbi:MAG: glycosyltransferase family 4 protein [Polaromonas sp.]
MGGIDASVNPPPSSVLMVTRELSGDRRYGLGRSLMPVVQALQRRQWRVRYLCQEDLPDSAKTDRARWLAWLGRLPGLKGVFQRQLMLGALVERLQMGWFAAQTARREGFACVYLHDPWLACGFWLGMKGRKSGGVRWGVAEHGFGCYSRATHEDGLIQGPRAQRWLRRIETFVLAKAHWVTSPTKLSLDQLARDLALPCNPGHWRAIAHASLQMALPSREQARSELSWNDNNFYVLGVGRLAPLKRFDLLVEAWAQLARRYPSLHLQLLGGGDTQNFQRMADAAGLGDRIHFAVVEDVRPYLAAADVYVSTSTTESFGLANLEALVAGLPCICTAVGGVPEVMGQGAWLIPVEQQALQSALNELIAQPAQRQAWAARAVAQARQAPDIETVTNHYAELFTR